MIKYSKSKHFTLSLSCKYTYKTSELVLRARFLIKLLFYQRKKIQQVYFHLQYALSTKKDLQTAGLPKSFKKMIILSKIR